MVWQEPGFLIGEDGEKWTKVLHHFVIFYTRNEQRGGNHHGKGKEPEVKSTGNVKFRTPSPHSPLLNRWLTLHDVAV